MCSANMGEGGESSAGAGMEEQRGWGGGFGGGMLGWDGMVETPLESLGRGRDGRSPKAR